MTVLHQIAPLMQETGGGGRGESLSIIIQHSFQCAMWKKAQKAKAALQTGGRTRGAFIHSATRTEWVTSSRHVYFIPGNKLSILNKGGTEEAHKLSEGGGSENSHPLTQQADTRHCKPTDIPLQHVDIRAFLFSTLPRGGEPKYFLTSRRT